MSDQSAFSRQEAFKKVERYIGFFQLLDRETRPGFNKELLSYLKGRISSREDAGLLKPKESDSLYCRLQEAVPQRIGVFSQIRYHFFRSLSVLVWMDDAFQVSVIVLSTLTGTFAVLFLIDTLHPLF